MKHLLSWRLTVILAAAALLGGCRTTPPPRPTIPQPRDPTWVRPKPGDPTRVQPKPRTLAPETPAAARSMLAGYVHDPHARPYYVRPHGPRPFWREPGPPRRYEYPRRPWRGPGYVPWREPGYVMPRPRPYLSVPRPAYPERGRGWDYVPNPGLPARPKPGQSWGAPGDTLRPQLEYKPLALSNQG